MSSEHEYISPSADKLGYLVKRAQQAVRRRMDRALREADLTTPQFAALEALGSGAGLSNADLARACFVTPQTMNLILRGLEEAGLARRGGAPEHGRAQPALLTQAGEAVLDRAVRLAEAAEEELFGRLEYGERRALAEYLARVAAD